MTASLRALRSPLPLLLICVLAACTAAPRGSSVEPAAEAPASDPSPAEGQDHTQAAAADESDDAAWRPGRERDLLVGAELYGGSGGAATQAVRWQESRPDDAEQLMKLARQPAVEWLGPWSGGDIAKVTEQRTDSARKQGKVAVFAVYNMVDRDCGLYSAGGAESADAYKQWIEQLAWGIGDDAAAVILEPDAVGHIDCLPAERHDERFGILRHAVATLEALPRTALYIDAGHSDWMPVDVAAARLVDAGIEQARGFGLNVSNFQTTEDLVAYGTAVAEAVGGDPLPHFVLDTSRNGNGPWPPEEDPTGESWCNPPGRALGQPPTTDPGIPLVDALLWVKHPGESDGDCRGGPPAGQWWGEYALGLAQRAPDYDY